MNPLVSPPTITVRTLAGLSMIASVSPDREGYCDELQCEEDSVRVVMVGIGVGVGVGQRAL